MSKISELPVLVDAKGHAYIPVVDPDETDPALQNKRIFLSTLTAAAENFVPYDPAETYSKDKPDYVSYNGNVYEYINNTPAAGKTPFTQPLYWRLVTAGQFAHIQNTDTHTTNSSYTIGSASSQDQSSWRVQEFRGTGRSKAIGYYFDWSQTPEVHEFMICQDYTGDPYTSTWEPFGGGGGGFRSVATLADLYDLITTDPGSLTLYETRIFVISEGNEYRLIDMAEADNALGWEAAVKNSAITSLNDEITYLYADKAEKKLFRFQPTGDYTVNLNHIGFLITVNSATDIIITCPNDINFNGAQFLFKQIGTGKFTFVGSGGATVVNFEGAYTSAGQNAVVSLFYYDGVWTPNGNLII